MSLFCNFIKTVKKQCFFINDKLSARSRIGLNTLHIRSRDRKQDDATHNRKAKIKNKSH